MGEAADLALEGIVCEWCGQYLGESVGYPRKCESCEQEEDGQSNKK